MGKSSQFRRLFETSRSFEQFIKTEILNNEENGYLIVGKSKYGPGALQK